MRLFFFCILCLFSSLSAGNSKKTYDLSNDPIDVVIPCTFKDLPTLNLCIEGIKINGKNIRRIVVVSPEKLTDQAEWFDEKNYPFKKFDVAKAIFNHADIAKKYCEQENRLGWILQQLLKLYAPFVIPGLSSNVLVLDADVIFLNPVEFLNPSNGAFLTIAKEHHKPYFVHMKKLIPGLKREMPRYSGVAHHMLFQRSILKDLLDTIEKNHAMPAWQALCRCIDRREIQGSCLSEYEIYFNFALARTNQVQVRHLKWENLTSLNPLKSKQQEGYHYIAVHSYSLSPPPQGI